MIYKKLSEFKKQEVKLVRDTKGFNYKYATLSQIQEKISPIVEKLGLLITHRIENNQVITSIIDLEDDTKIESSIHIWEVNSKRIEKFQDKNWKDVEVITENTLDPQWVWSIITYYRRYNLLALLDLETEDDDWSSGSNNAQAKNYQSDNKPWFNKPQLDKLSKVKDQFDNWEDALKAAQEKYKVSKEMQQEILNLYK